MTSTDIKRVVQSIERSLVKPIKVTREFPGIHRISLPFKDLLGEPFYLWVFRHKQTNQIVLSDGRFLTRVLANATGSINLQAVQVLVKTYGLSLMEDESVMEISDRPIAVRVTEFLQCIVAVDGVYRMWNTLKESKTA